MKKSELLETADLCPSHSRTCTNSVHTVHGNTVCTNPNMSPPHWSNCYTRVTANELHAASSHHIYPGWIDKPWNLPTLQKASLSRLPAGLFVNGCSAAPTAPEEMMKSHSVMWPSNSMCKWGGGPGQGSLLSDIIIAEPLIQHTTCAWLSYFTTFNL